MALGALFKFPLYNISASTLLRKIVIRDFTVYFAAFAKSSSCGCCA